MADGGARGRCGWSKELSPVEIETREASRFLGWCQRVILAHIVAIERYSETGIGKITPTTIVVRAPLSLPIQVAADAPFPLPVVLNCLDVSIRHQNGNELPLNFILDTEFKTLHASDDLTVELINTEGFPVEHVNVGGGTEPTTHPRMVHYF